MPRFAFSALVLATALLFPTVGAAQQVPVNQIDTFQDGTTMSWTYGATSTISPTNVSTGGPAGAGDRYLNIVSFGGFGANSRLVVFNQQQWGGTPASGGAKTYSPAITGLSMDLNNFGSTSLTMRVAFQDISGDEYSTAGVSLAPAPGWHPVVFSLTDSNMTTLSGTQPFDAALSSGIMTMRILNSASPAFNGDPIAAQLGIDNIKVFTAVPEPGMVLLTAAAGFFIPRAWRRVRAARGTRG
jgi:hypothetical protein